MEDRLELEVYSRLWSLRTPTVVSTQRCNGSSTMNTNYTNILLYNVPKIRNAPIVALR